MHTHALINVTEQVVKDQIISVRKTLFNAVCIARTYKDMYTNIIFYFV